MRFSRPSLFTVLAGVILIGGLIAVGSSYLRQHTARTEGATQRAEHHALVAAGLEITRRYDSQINALVQEGAYCVPRCRMAYRAPRLLQKGNENFFNSWEMVTDAAALRVLSFAELDADRHPQFRLLISYATLREDGDLQAADPKFADFLAKLMQRFEFPAAFVRGECPPEITTGNSVYRCKQNPFWWGEFPFDPVLHPSVKAMKAERTITLIRPAPTEESPNG